MKLPYICLMLLMFNYQYHKLFQVHVCQFIKKNSVSMKQSMVISDHELIVDGLRIKWAKMSGIITSQFVTKLRTIPS